MSVHAPLVERVTETNETPVVIRPIHIHHPVVVDFVSKYNEPLARAHAPDVAPFQSHSDTEPLAVPVMQSPVIVHHTHTEREVIHVRESLPPTSFAETSPPRPEPSPLSHPEAPSVSASGRDAERQQAPVEAVSPRQRIAKPENGTSTSDTPVEVPSVAEEKASEKLSTEIKASEKGASRKLYEYNGSGRRHSDEQIDEILDEYLMSGKLPKYVSDRQRRDYRKHKRLELRRMYLEQAGIQTIPGAKEDSSNILRMAERKAQRQKRAASGV